MAAAFDAHELPWGSALDVDGSRVVLETYMASFVLGSEAESLEKASLLRKLGEVGAWWSFEVSTWSRGDFGLEMPCVALFSERQVHQQYPTWPNTQAFIEEIRQEMVPNQEKLTWPSGISMIQAHRGGSSQI